MVNVTIIKTLLAKNDGTLRIIIPKEIREKLKIKAGDKLLVSYDKKKRIVFQKLDQSL